MARSVRELFYREFWELPRHDGKIMMLSTKGSNLSRLTMLKLFSHHYSTFNLICLLLSVGFCYHISLPKSDPLSGAHIVYFLNSLKTVKVFKYFISFPNFIKPWALTYYIILGGGGGWEGQTGAV
jgi:hypothetical protein